MNNHPIISQHLDASGAYSDLSAPVLVTSGTSLTPFFVNAEKLCGDKEIGKVLKANEHNSIGILLHSIQLYETVPNFKKVIDIMTEEFESVFREKTEDSHIPAISGV